MVLRTLGIGVLVLALAACGSKEEPETVTAAPAPPPTAPAALPAPPDLSALGFVFQPENIYPSTQISVAPGERGVILTRVAEGVSTEGLTTGAYVGYGFTSVYDLSGITYRITVTAASASEEEAPFSVAYSTSNKGDSGWNEFVATPEMAEYSFEYTVPAGADDNFDFVGISVEDGVSIEVASVAFEAVQ